MLDDLYTSNAGGHDSLVAMHLSFIPKERVIEITKKAEELREKEQHRQMTEEDAGKDLSRDGKQPQQPQRRNSKKLRQMVRRERYAQYETDSKDQGMA